MTNDYTRRRRGPAPSIQALLHRSQAVLKGIDDPGRTARLRYVIGRMYEEVVGDEDRAREQYLGAASGDPELLPNLRAARRLMSKADDWQAVLDMIEAELRIELEPEPQAEIYLERGKILDRELGDLDGAREAFACAMELDETNPEAWRLLARSLHRAEAWMELDDVLARVMVRAQDPRLQAALLTRRGTIQAYHLGDQDAAVELFEEALSICEDHLPAIHRLKRLYRERGQWIELIELLGLELRLLDGPAKIRAYYELAHLHARRQGRADLAIELLEKAERIEPEDVLILTELGRLYHQSALYREQIRVEGRLLELTDDPDEQLALHLRMGATCEEQLGDHEGAIEHYLAAVKGRPGFVPAASALGRLCYRHERWEELLEMFRLETLEASEAERLAQTHYRAAEVLEGKLGRLDEAVGQYREALRWAPAFRPASRALHRLYREREQWDDLVSLYEDEAESLAGRSLSSTNTDSLRLSRLEQAGRLLEEKVGDIDRAIDVYARILDADPSHAGALHALERCYEAAGLWGELMELLEREVEVIEDESWDTALLHQIGEIAQDRLDDQDLAVLYYRRALTISPDFVPSLTALGRIYGGKGRWQELIAMYRREIEVAESAEDRTATMFKLGELYQHRLEQEQEAEDAYRECLDLEPNFWPAANALEQMLGRRRDWSALAELQEHRARYRSDPRARAVAYLDLGELWEERLGRLDEAADAYRAALEADPSLHAARTALTRLYEQVEAWHKLGELLDDQLAQPDQESGSYQMLLDLFDLWRHRLEDPDRAVTISAKLLERRTNDLAILMELADVYRQLDRWEDLAQTCRRLAKATDDPLITVGALRELAVLLRDHLAQPEEAAEVWHMITALRPEDLAARGALGGRDPDSEDISSFPAVVSAAFELIRQTPVPDKDLPRTLDALQDTYVATEDWRGLTKALKHLREVLDQKRGVPDETLEDLEIELALAESQRPGNMGGAEERLTKILERRPDHHKARAVLAELIARDERRGDQAAEHFERAFRGDPTLGSAIRGLGRLWRRADELDRGHCALGVLRALDQATSEEQDRFGALQRARNAEPGAPLDREALASGVGRGIAAPAEAAALLQALSPHLHQIARPNLMDYGLEREDRIPPPDRHPLRQRGERVSWLLSVPAFDIYLHDQLERPAAVEPGDPLGLILPEVVAEWPEDEQVFLLGWLLSHIALGTWIVRRYSAVELEVMLAAAARLHATDLSIEAASDETLDVERDEMRRQLPKDVIEGLEAAARAHAAAPRPDYEDWMAAMDLAAARAALLIGGDLAAAFAVWRKTEPDLDELSPADLLTHIPPARDLLEWYLSDDHLELRRLAGLSIG